MDIDKQIQGHYITITLEKIKDYDRFSLYQVFRTDGESKKPLYKECYSKFQMDELKRNHYRIRIERYE